MANTNRRKETSLEATRRLSKRKVKVKPTPNISNTSTVLGSKKIKQGFGETLGEFAKRKVKHSSNQRKGLQNASSTIDNWKSSVGTKVKTKPTKSTKPVKAKIKIKTKTKVINKSTPTNKAKKGYSAKIQAEQRRLWKAGAYGNVSESKAVDGFDGPMTRRARAKSKSSVTSQKTKGAKLNTSAIVKPTAKITVKKKTASKVTPKVASNTKVNVNKLTDKLDKASNPMIKSERERPAKPTKSKRDIRKAKRKAKRKDNRAKRKARKIGGVKNTSNVQRDIERRFNPMR